MIKKLFVEIYANSIHHNQVFKPKTAATLNNCLFVNLNYVDEISDVAYIMDLRVALLQNENIN